MASVPTFEVSGEEEPGESQRGKAVGGSSSLLSVPAPVRSNIGINNPDKKGGLFPLATSQQVVGSATGNPRNKVALAPGCSLMDWVRLTKSGKDLSGVGGPMVKGKPREVTRQELKKHRKRKDAWMALNGAVYNVTQYMDFHPGGWDELVKGAGRDATDMFNEIHKWVNYQGMLEACLVGKLVDGPSEELLPPPKISSPALLPPPVLPPIKAKPAPPTMDFFQTETKLTVNIYTKRKGLERQNVIVDNAGETLRVSVTLSEEIFLLNVRLTSPVNLSNVIRIGASSGKIEIDLTKSTPGRWKSLGTPLDNHLWFGQRKDVAETYREWKVVRVREATHNTRHLVLSPPPGLHLRPGLGQHLVFRTVVEGLEVTRSYTPVPSLIKQEVEDEGCLQFLIKIYPNGLMTPSLGRLTVGDSVSVSNHTGSFRAAQVPVTPDSRLLLLAAGTGLTPILGLLAYLQTRPSRPVVQLVTFDRREEDIIWRAEVDQFQAENAGWLRVRRVLSEAGPGWTGQTGRVRPDLLGGERGQAGAVWAAVCGPPGFNRETVRILRDHICSTLEEIHVFEG